MKVYHPMLIALTGQEVGFNCLMGRESSFQHKGDLYNVVLKAYFDHYSILNHTKIRL